MPLNYDRAGKLREVAQCRGCGLRFPAYSLAGTGLKRRLYCTSACKDKDCYARKKAKWAANPKCRPRPAPRKAHARHPGVAPEAMRRATVRALRELFGGWSLVRKGNFIETAAPGVPLHTITHVAAVEAARAFIQGNPHGAWIALYLTDAITLYDLCKAVGTMPAATLDYVARALEDVRRSLRDVEEAVDPAARAHPEAEGDRDPARRDQGPARPRRDQR